MVPSEWLSIVVADDDDALRAVIAECLRSAGMVVWEASDGEQAVALVRRRRPSVLLLDLWMPGLDGLRVLDALRFDPAANRLEVVILTGDAQADGRLLALAGGAARILLKGGPVEELIGVVRRCAERARGAPFEGLADGDRRGEEPGAVPAGAHAAREPQSTGLDLP